MPVLRLFASVSALILCSCAMNTASVAAGASKKGAVETLSIQAVRETVPVASTGDAADDPAIWRNPVDPAKSLIVATDKDWGLVHLRPRGRRGRLRASRQGQQCRPARRCADQR
ncbi:phytase [Caulobacter segnis]